MSPAFPAKGGGGWSFFLDFYIGKIQNCHQKRKVVIEKNIPYREFAKKVPPPSTVTAKNQARSTFMDERGTTRGE